MTNDEWRYQQAIALGALSLAERIKKKLTLVKNL